MGVGLRGLPLGLACGELLITDVQVNLGVIRVDGNGVTVLNQGDWAAQMRFRGHMTNHETVGTTREPAIGQQCDILRESATVDGTGGAQHFPHARPAFRPFVAHDNDVALNDGAVHDRCHGRFLTVKAACLAGKRQAFVASDLCHRALRCQIAAQDHQVTVFFDGVRQWPDDLLIRWIVGDVGQIFRHGLTGYRHAVTVQKPFL